MAANGWVVTAGHVIRPESKTYVKIKNIWRPATLVDKSLVLDVPVAVSPHGISVIEINRYGDYATLRVDTGFIPPLFHAKEEIKKEENLTWFQYGCDKKFNGRLKNSFSGIYTVIWFDDFVRAHFDESIPRLVVIERMSANFLQVDSPTIHGSSGSPVLNSDGQVVGIVIINDYILKDWRGISIKNLYIFDDRGVSIFKNSIPDFPETMSTGQK